MDLEVRLVGRPEYRYVVVAVAVLSTVLTKRAILLLDSVSVEKVLGEDAAYVVLLVSRRELLLSHDVH